MTPSRSQKSVLDSTSAPMLAVYDGGNCVGRLLRRVQAGVEDFTADDISLGVYETEAAAASALWRHAHGPMP